MLNVSSAFFQDESEDDLDSFDDLDELFGRLESFSPPANMVERIMDAVSQLPPYHLIPESSGENQGHLIVQRENQLPS